MNRKDNLLGWTFILLVAFIVVNVWVWRWNHEAVRVYDMPRIPWWF